MISFSIRAAANGLTAGRTMGEMEKRKTDALKENERKRVSRVVPPYPLGVR